MHKTPKSIESLQVGQATLELLEPRLLLSSTTAADAEIIVDLPVETALLASVSTDSDSSLEAADDAVASDVTVADGVLSVSPSSADPGATNVQVTFSLDPNIQPPLPPDAVSPTGAWIGSIAGTSVTRDGTQVTAYFDIPAGEAAGMKDVSVTFSTPHGEMVFSKSSAFEVTGDSTPVGDPWEGYTLWAPLNETTTYLSDIDGEVVHTWDSDYRPGLAAYLTEDGSLLRMGNVNNATFTVGGAGGVTQLIDWDGNVTWEYTYSDEAYLSHHDVEILPNGNVLLIAWESRTYAQAVQAGRDPASLSDGELWPDSIIEVMPTGPTSGDIVWEWHVWDHLIQDHDAGRDNFGVVADHPELIDINHVSGPGGADWTHVNSIDYNAEFDQILLSVHSFNEIWVIDHSTTTAESADHTGGNNGRGGDLLYRWGNPQTYNAGTSADQQLFRQHDAQWIGEGLPGEGNISIFNNGLGRSGDDYSSVVEIVTPVNPDGSYISPAGSAYGPEEPVWTYTSEVPTDFYAQNISGAQRLANGNTLICDGPNGDFFEVDADGQTVWQYDHTAGVFKVRRYGAAYPGFDDTPLDDEVDVVGTYPIVDTGQTGFYNNSSEIAEPGLGDAFYGQDANFDGYQPSYTTSADGLVVLDNVTSLTWTQGADWTGDGVVNASDKFTYADAQTYVDTLNAQNYGGHDDWRVPTIKELYSLIDYRGTDPNPEATGSSGLVPFIDADVFEFAYGDTSAGERIIDSQWATSTLYVSTVMGGTQAMFGVNFADGRIKGYPAVGGPGGVDKTYYVRFCRGNTDYGTNNFTDNGDGTVTDSATGLVWSQHDSGTGMNWEDALAWVQARNDENYLGHDNWRLPNAKELQSLVDYTRSPDTTSSAAIDPIFSATQITNVAGQSDYPFYWSGTTFLRFTGSASAAVYVAFGRGLGSMDGTNVIDVHGAGCQRSDPKDGNSGDYPSWGNGPQGDLQRVFNHVRLVRDADVTAPAQVVGRYVFYNNSDLDDNDPGASAADDGAIATDKALLLPGEIVTSANCAAYSRGINGLMVDIDSLGGTPTVGDFEFSVNAPGDPDNWTPAPAPTSITVRRGEGAGQSDRVTIIWADNAIENQWVRVTVLAGDNTGLARDDAFSFGSTIGDCDSDGQVGSDDYIEVISQFGLRGEGLTADFNADGRVNLSDFAIMRANRGNSVLPPTATPAAAPSPVAMSQAAPVLEPDVDIDLLEAPADEGVTGRRDGFGASGHGESFQLDSLSTDSGKSTSPDTADSMPTKRRSGPRTAGQRRSPGDDSSVDRRTGFRRGRPLSGGLDADSSLSDILADSPVLMPLDS
ncbi:MAG: DUF1566 domain-containing protein [Phycisphaerae bacterium]|jgi:hypothetical protein|nr:DUF1566 domain-containing protein [Phycisphaerae bacterium]